MKILSISIDKKILIDGSENQNRQKEYGELCDELHIIVLNKKQKIRKKISDKVWLYSTGSISKFLYFWDALLISRGIDKVNLVTSQDPFGVGFIAYFISKLKKAKLHLQVHTDFTNSYFKEESFLNSIYYLLGTFLVKGADCIRVVSKRTYINIKKLTKNNTPITILPIFVDVKKIQSSEIKANLRERYNGMDNIFLMASRLTKEKNIKMAISAMNQLIRKRPGSILVIVGSGPEKENLNSYIKDLGVEDNVKLENWNNELVSYYKTADAFVITSDYEGYARTAVEAMASGCPVIMTDVGIAGDLVKDNYSGLVIPARDRDTLIRSMNNIIGEEDLKRKLIDNGYKALASFINKAEYLKLYKESWDNCL